MLQHFRLRVAGSGANWRESRPFLPFNPCIVPQTWQQRHSLPKLKRRKNQTMGEFDYIAWLRKQKPASSRILIGPGDDCAVLSSTPGQPWLVTTDMLLDG